MSHPPLCEHVKAGVLAPCDMCRIDALEQARDATDEALNDLIDERDRYKAALMKIVEIGDGDNWSIRSDMRGLVYGTAQAALEVD